LLWLLSEILESLSDDCEPLDWLTDDSDKDDSESEDSENDDSDGDRDGSLTLDHDFSEPK